MLVYKEPLAIVIKNSVYSLISVRVNNYGIVCISDGKSVWNYDLNTMLEYPPVFNELTINHCTDLLNMAYKKVLTK